MDEFDRISRFFAPLSSHSDAFGLRDDAAQLSPPAGKRFVITMDTLVEGVHFIGDEDPALLARKALRVNLSDLAAKGAIPYGYLLSLSLPDRCDDAWVAAFAEGLRQDQEFYGISLLGGDSTRAPQHISICITALGATDNLVRRKGAQAGDVLFVTGTIGDAYLGLQVAQGKAEANDYLLGRYQQPQARTAMADAVALYANACLDVSDGLLQDAGHLARESGIAAHIALETIPVTDAAHDRMALVTGGDDYELLLAAPAETVAALKRAAHEAGTMITAIGICREGEGVHLTDEGKAVELPSKLGWKHS